MNKIAIAVLLLFAGTVYAGTDTLVMGIDSTAKINICVVDADNTMKICCPECGKTMKSNFETTLKEIEQVLDILESNPYATKEFRKQLRRDRKRLRSWVKEIKLLNKEIDKI